MLTLFREQPRAFHMIFMLELWERFGFYAVQGVLTVYFIRYLAGIIELSTDLVELPCKFRVYSTIF